MSRSRKPLSQTALQGAVTPQKDKQLIPTPSAWFLGPNAENEKHLLKFAKIAIEEQSKFRRDYARDDPPFVTKALADSQPHKDTHARTESELRKILKDLRNSVPLASYRNQSHMFWDITLPGAAGYFAGMLYNQNNCAAEASPVTTGMEIEVAEALCTMLGYDMEATPRPWGHITCDGSIANAEAMWAARNLKFQGVAVAAALEGDPALHVGRNLTVKCGDGRRRKLLDLTRWEQLNLPVDEALALLDRIVETTGLPSDIVGNAVDARSVQNLGILGFYNAHLANTAPKEAVIFAPATAHYSWPKGAAILGHGKASVRLIPIDLDGRMNLALLRAALEECLETHTPVAQVVGVMGSTKESAVDPIADMLAIRDEYAERGLTFAMHADAAWGGYFASIIRGGKVTFVHPDQPTGWDLGQESYMSPHVLRQFKHLGQMDSITIDPHKSGFMPYPAGALCYRNDQMPRLIMHTAPVVFHGGDAPTVGVYGIEGSKPGAAAVGTLLSHRVISTDAMGYGTLLGRCLFNAKRYYAATVALPTDATPYTITPFKRLPIEVEGCTEVEKREQIDLIRAEFIPQSNANLAMRIAKKPALRKLFEALGPDLTVFAYAFNFRTAAGINTDPELMNEMNDRMYDALSLQVTEHKDIPAQDMFVTAATFDPAIYGHAVVESFAARAGLSSGAAAPVNYLISTMQNPWITDTSGGNFIPTLMEVLDRTARDVIDTMIKRHGLSPFTPPKV